MNAIKTTFFLLVLSFLPPVQAQDFNKSMAEIMKSMKAYTIEMAQLMPEEKFAYRPTDSVLTFKGQLEHMVATNHFFLNYFLRENQDMSREKAVENSIEYAERSDQNELVGALAEQFDETIAFFKEAPKTSYAKRYNFGSPDHPLLKDHYTTAMLVRDHMAHHRAQLIVYLRLNHIRPAQFRGF